MRQDRQPLVPPAAVPQLRPDAVLRPEPEQAHDRPQSRGRTPDDAVRPARRGLAVVLPRRAVLHPRRRRRLRGRRVAQPPRGSRPGPLVRMTSARIAPARARSGYEAWVPGRVTLSAAHATPR